MSEFFTKHRERILSAALWLLVLLPVIGCAKLMREHAQDQRFLDDWVWAQDLVKWKEGTLKVSDIFAVHLEHRPAIPRALALFVTLLAGGDVQAQCGLSFLWLVISFVALCSLWLRGGLKIRDAWLPLLLACATMFTPVQWQNLLWPICCETFMPAMFLLLALCVALKPWSWWVKGMAGSGLAVCAMLSFASGVLLWVLPLPVFLFCGGINSMRDKLRFITLWSVVLAVTMLCYFHNFKNSVPSQYAYGHGEENTMLQEIPYFLEHPFEDLQFLCVFCGALPARGWAADTKNAALIVGGVLLAGLVLLAWFCWHFRKDEELRARLLPMLCLGAYSPGTGLLVAIGRIYAGHVGTALNVRYHVHQTQLIIALVGGALFLARHFAKRPTSLASPMIWSIGGSLAGVLGVGWIFGASMMENWEAARLRNSAAQYISQTFPDFSHYVAFVSGGFSMTVDTTRELAKHHLLNPAPLADRRISKLHLSSRVLGLERAILERLYKVEGRDANGAPHFDWHADGSASLPVSNARADGILFAYRVPGGEWTIFGFTQGAGPPFYLPRALGKDVQFTVPGGGVWDEQTMFGWSDLLTVCEQPPAGSQVSVWAMDMERKLVHRISRNKKGKVDEDGEVLETLAQKFVPKREKD